MKSPDTITSIEQATARPLRVGDTVIRREWAHTKNPMKRLVMAVGSGEQFAGYVRVTGSIAWEHERHFQLAGEK